jgi:hypothetical protein
MAKKVIITMSVAAVTILTILVTGCPGEAGSVGSGQVISSYNPTVGTYGETEVIAIFGSNFTENTQFVLVNGGDDLSADSVALLSDKYCEATFNMTGLPAGTCTLRVVDGTNTGTAAQQFTLIVGDLLDISNIDPKVGYNNGSVTINVSGNNFTDGVTLKLTKGVNEVIGTDMTIHGNSSLSCTMDLTGQPVGFNWAVELTHPSLGTTIFPNFHVKTETALTSVTPSIIARKNRTVTATLKGLNFNEIPDQVILHMSGETSIVISDTNITLLDVTTCMIDYDIDDSTPLGEWSVTVDYDDAMSTCSDVTLTDSFIIEPVNIARINVIGTSANGGSWAAPYWHIVQSNGNSLSVVSGIISGLTTVSSSTVLTTTIPLGSYFAILGGAGTGEMTKRYEFYDQDDVLIYASGDYTYTAVNNGIGAILRNHNQANPDLYVRFHYTNSDTVTIQNINL